MSGMRWALAVATPALAASLGMGAWLFTHQGYPNTVYYERLQVMTNMLPATVRPAELWVDPARNAALRITGTGAAHSTYLIERGAHDTVVVEDGVTFGGDPLSPEDARSFRGDNALLARGGFRALAEGRLAHATGPVAHAMFNGHAALRFTTTLHSGDASSLTVWIDARTHAPLQLQISYSGYSLTQTIVQTRQLAPGSLPADFFDPPRKQASYWEQALSWVHTHLIPSR